MLGTSPVYWPFLEWPNIPARMYPVVICAVSQGELGKLALQIVDSDISILGDDKELLIF
jgi:hypothetical protein